MAETTSTSTESGDGTVTRRGTNGLAIAGLVCGLVGLIVVPVILGPLALIFGGVAWSRANRGANHRGMAIAAVVLGVIDLVVWVVVVVALAKHGGAFSYHVG
jgi:hypothetical protein